MIVAASVVAGMLAVTLLVVPTVSEHIDQFFAVNDSHRGLNSGASGRVKTWKETWHLALDHPFTGVGLRAHESLLKTNSSAHNGYLATLAEIGFIGFALVMALVVSGIQNLWRRQKDAQWQSVQGVLLGLALGYMVLALFERYLINLGNATSLLFLLAILFPSVAAGSQDRGVREIEIPNKAPRAQVIAVGDGKKVLRRAV